ncbi:nutritionally-regulated adipose and cardiac enriched protein homolog isoform X2 [Canis lupus dingo]|uniref:nutritionally-regulated adipose and cardiac enriched protein homolog isoform X2 n=1 Tax=Canis lupus dingo TaxID=286419 RepID=UPI0006B3CB73|nr:nutritionally-regulated adipose and cardiac enriched protein homolog isoform X2 [Canis lupus dingo]|eukprot:XP_013971647.1 nutritionally-regulated adipose and cardiac enriched protein homolog isoform X1 [Canis lupus familiaris]
MRAENLPRAGEQDHVPINEDCRASLEPRLPARDATSDQDEWRGRSGLADAQGGEGGRQEVPPVHPEAEPDRAPRRGATEDLEAGAVPGTPGGGRALHRQQRARHHHQGAQPAPAPTWLPVPAPVRVRPAGAGARAVLRPGPAGGAGPGGPPGPAPRPRPAPEAYSPELLALPAAAVTAAPTPGLRVCRPGGREPRSGLGASRGPTPSTQSPSCCTCRGPP